MELTHGGFYRHFDSKEALFGAAIVKSVEELGERLSAVADGANPKQRVKAIVDTYLSTLHCENPADGCPAAALASEIPRHSAEVREMWAAAFRRYVDRLAAYMPGRTLADRRRNFRNIFTGMVGTLITARSIGDTPARQELLRSAREFYTASLSGD